MVIFPLVYWKIVTLVSNDNVHIQLDQLFLNTGKGTISGSRWTNETTLQDMIQLYGILMMVDMPLFPGATYTAYWTYGLPMFPWTNILTLRRFNQFRSILHLNSNATEVCPAQDASFYEYPQEDIGYVLYARL
jgi:hypothetical protein